MYRIKEFFFLVLFIVLSSIGTGQIISTKSVHFQVDSSMKSGELIELPQIVWINPALEYSNSTKNDVTLKAEVSATSDLEEVEIQLVEKSNKQIIGTKIYELREGKRGLTIEKNFFLPDGDILISLKAKTKKGGTVLSTRSILVGMDAMKNAVSIDRKDYALIFATNKYDNWSDLVNPIYDGNSIAKELRETYGFEVEVVENTTKKEVFRKILEYNRKAYKPQDQLMIFFAGHGQFDEDFGEGYVVAKNSVAIDKSKTSYISHSRLKTVINNIPCKHIFLTMDVCFGGTLDPEIAASRGGPDITDPDKDFLAKKLSHTTRRYLTSGGKEYVSDGIPGEHSPFAQKFIEALRTYGGSDRILTLSEIKTELEKLEPTPRMGEFGKNEDLSDFLFIKRAFQKDALKDDEK
ncbi:Caspase domain-containing protein [Marivirga sericea]|uniref:Caspase domain-containing protein n=2 Tax=Marivirga sericea TaxID=1028 RepID=A0A1X7JBT3_9BACT|nr:Caspase domain-containing protein [Marivirga sericea]